MKACSWAIFTCGCVTHNSMIEARLCMRLPSHVVHQFLRRKRQIAIQSPVALAHVYK